MREACVQAGGDPHVTEAWFAPWTLQLSGKLRAVALVSRRGAQWPLSFCVAVPSVGSRNFTPHPPRLWGSG